MADSRAEGVCRRLEQLRSYRANFESLWQQIAERILPGEAQFNTKRTPGEERTEKMMDTTAALALRKYATILESLSTPSTHHRHKPRPGNEALKDSGDVKEYRDRLNRLLYSLRYAPTANFAGQIGTAKLGLGAFGTSIMHVEADPVYGLRYRAIPLAEAYLAENHVGLINTVFREWEMSAENILAKWPDTAPPDVRRAAEKSPDQMFTVIHAVRPIGEDEARKLPQGMQFSSLYVCKASKTVLDDSGYYTFPYPISRDITSAGEIYGRSPAVWALPDIKMMNEMNRSIMRAAQKAVDPPLLASEDGALSPFSLRPGFINPGTLDDNGNELVKPLQSKADVGLGVDLLALKAQAINESFYITLFQILVDNHTMTATEVMERAQEKGMLLGPVIGRDQSEFLGPLIEREIDLLARNPAYAWIVREMPEQLIESGARYKIEYDSPMTRAMRAGDGVAIMRTFDGLAPWAQIRPEVFDNFDVDGIARTLSDINGVPADLILPDEVVDKYREDKAQQMAAQVAMANAPQLAEVAQAAA